MAAYEPSFEYIKLANAIKFGNVNDMKKTYYGFEVPDVDILIRSWRPKLSGCLPIMVSEYSDIYFFTAPFQYFKLRDFETIIQDYSNRTDSINMHYGKDEMETIKKFSENIKDSKIFVIGKKINKTWFPFK